MTVGQALERAEELRPGSRVSVHTRHKPDKYKKCVQK